MMVMMVLLRRTEGTQSTSTARTEHGDIVVMVVVEVGVEVVVRVAAVVVMVVWW